MIAKGLNTLSYHAGTAATGSQEKIDDAGAEEEDPFASLSVEGQEKMRTLRATVKRFVVAVTIN